MAKIESKRIPQDLSPYQTITQHDADKAAALATRLAANPLYNLPTATRLFHPHHLGGSRSDNAPGTSTNANQLNAYPLPVVGTWTITELGVFISSAGSNDGVLRLGIYDKTIVSGKPYPGALLKDAGQFTANLGSTYFAIVINPALTLTEGQYFLAFHVSSVATQPVIPHSRDYIAADLGGTVMTASPPVKSRIFVTGAGYNPLPDPFPAGGTYDWGIFLIGIKIGSIT